jgi:hypothetical protein
LAVLEKHPRVSVWDLSEWSWCGDLVTDRKVVPSGAEVIAEVRAAIAVLAELVAAKGVLQH